MSGMDKKLSLLMRDFGFKLEGSALISLPTAGYPARIFRSGFRSLFQAAEFLIPVIADDEYYQRYKRVAG